MRRALDEHFATAVLEWRPYLFRCLERDDLESTEREAIAQGQIQPVGFRYVASKLDVEGDEQDVSNVHSSPRPSS